MPATDSSLLALDVGSARIGLAIASRASLLPSPYRTLNNDENFLSSIKQIIEEENIDSLIIGLPRNLSGESTAQTQYVEEFVKNLKESLSLPMYLQDEALTSAKAEDELKQRGKPYTRGDIDALAATYILEDYLKEQGIS